MQKPRIFVVEDNSLVALDICQSLAEFGYDVVAPISSGELAVSGVQETNPDVVIMDIRLSGAMDGVTAAAHISDICEVPVIFLTAHADKATLERAKIVEPFAYILKPFENIELHAAIQMLLYKEGWQDTASGLEKSAQSLENVDVLIEETVESRIAFLRSIHFFSQLNETELAQLANACVSKLVKKDELLVDAERGEVPAFIVQSGRIAMIETAASSEGSIKKERKRELMLELVEPGDLFGLISAVDKFPTPIIPIANRESQVLLIPKKTFVLLLEAYPALAIAFAKYVTSRLRVAQLFARAIAYDDVQTRISSTVDALAQRAESDERMVSLDLTRKELAQLTGTTVETVVRVLKILEKTGQVQLGQRRRLKVRNPRVLDG